MWKFSEFSDYILFCTNLQMDWYELGYLYNQYLRADTRMFYRYVKKLGDWKPLDPTHFNNLAKDLKRIADSN